MVTRSLAMVPDLDVSLSFVLSPADKIPTAGCKDSLPFFHLIVFPHLTMCKYDQHLELLIDNMFIIKHQNQYLHLSKMSVRMIFLGSEQFSICTPPPSDTTVSASPAAATAGPASHFHIWSKKQFCFGSQAV